ncbi:hypothetical protein [Paenibacillus periandrae]|uniref:hypothetical protein n=1 Tax=Paenibacillus periandrae TaxID=1761741 RepID=UPI001F09D683|nr:hypothetical protein [Paenibacillus periandrae]
MKSETVWGIFVASDSSRFPNFFPIGLYTTQEKALTALNSLPRDTNYQLLKLPLNKNFAYYHKKSGNLVGMDDICHEHFHYKDANNNEGMV